MQHVQQYNQYHFLVHNYKKIRRRDKEKNQCSWWKRASWQLWQTNPRRDQFQNHLYHAQIRMREKEFCDITLASVDGPKLSFKHQVSFSRNYWWIKKIIIHSYSWEEKRMKVTCYIHLHLELKLERNQVEPFCEIYL